MARTIKAIANGMKADFVRNATLRAAYALTDYDSDASEQEMLTYYANHFSEVSVETVIINIVAVCAAVIENMTDIFQKDVDRIVGEERYGHQGWYEATAKAFQYSGNQDYGLDESTGHYGVISEDAKIISQASCREYGRGVKLKVAKGEIGSLEPLNADELGAFTAYINRLKPAGIPVRVISGEADRLALHMSVYYDPLTFTEANALIRVKEVITAYLQGIYFSGEYVTQDMVDRLQAVPGLDIIEVGTVRAKHAGYGWEPIENDARYTPEPGYMTLGDDEDNEINMIANT